MRSDLCDGLITSPETPTGRACVRVCVPNCDIKQQQFVGMEPSWAVASYKINNR